MGSPQAKLPSPQERMELILLGMSRARPLEELCLQANVSRELFYRWMGRVRQAGLRALEPRRPGPKESRMEDPEAEIKKLRARVAALEKEKRSLRKTNDYLELVVKTAKRIIRRRGWEEPEAPVKKNDKRA